MRLSSDLIDLRDGPTLPIDAISLALALEARGHVLAVTNDRLVVTEGSRLTEDDRAAIKHRRVHLMALLDYCQKGVEPR